MIAAYEANIADVRRAVPKTRLLEFDVKECWAPLCAFLGVPVPASPFPKTNSTAEFVARGNPPGELGNY